MSPSPVERGAGAEVRPFRPAAGLTATASAGSVGRGAGPREHGFHHLHGLVRLAEHRARAAARKGSDALGHDDERVVVQRVVFERAVRSHGRGPAHPEREGPLEVLAEHRRSILEGSGPAAVVEDDAVAESVAALVALPVLEVARGVAPLVEASAGRGRAAAGDGRGGITRPRRGPGRRKHRRPVDRRQSRFRRLDARLRVVASLLAPPVVGRDLQLRGGGRGQGQPQERQEHQGQDGQDQREPGFRATAVSVVLDHGFKRLLNRECSRADGIAHVCLSATGAAEAQAPVAPAAWSERGGSTAARPWPSSCRAWRRGRRRRFSPPRCSALRCARRASPAPG